MKKWFNTGTLILGGAAGFLIFIFILLIDFIHRDLSLVSNNYYDQEINFDAHRLAIHNFETLDSAVLITYDQDHIELEINPSFNSKLINGFIEFYCPSDKNKDIKYKFVPNERGVYLFSRPLYKVSYILKLQLQDSSKAYYKENSI